MGIISRGIKNAFRNGIRTTSIIFILAVSISMALIMLMAMKTVQSKITSVKSSIGNNITIMPAGVRGFEGGGEALTDTDVSALAALPHINKIVKTISDRLTTEDTNLVSAIEPGSFGQRQQNRQNRQYQGGGNIEQRAPQNFAMPIMVTGTNELSSTASLNASKFDVISGTRMDANSNENIAMVGTELATKNNLSIDTIFKAYGQDVKLIGIFDAGNKFANSTVVMPVATLQKLSAQTDQITSIIIQADSIDSVTTLQNDIKAKLGDKADVTSQQDSSNDAVKPLENIKTVSLYSLIGSLIAGSIIILLTMIMIVRERRREIGVLKAIGSSNIGIMAMFTVESLVLTLTSSIAGIVFGLIFSNPVLKVLVNNSATATSVAPEHIGGGTGRIMMRMGGDAVNSAQNTLKELNNVVGWDIILYGLLAAVIIAIIGSSIPAFFISKIRPAEVMRAE
jgi:putative ABC transport system permease protein